MKGKSICKIIKDMTILNEQGHRRYISVEELRVLIQKIIETRETTDVLAFTPFYRNPNIEIQIEFDEDYMFCMTCRDRVNEQEIRNNIADCWGQDWDNLNEERIRIGKILFPLCDYDDTTTYKKALQEYEFFLDEMVNKMSLISSFYMEMNGVEFELGYFCFEVSCL